MSKTRKHKQSRWLLALAVLTTSSCGCASWNHHVGKHSLLSHFQKKHHSPYTQCEHCGQIILNDRYHQCNQCTPKPAFYGFKSTCWNAWPMGWSPCPAPDTNSCLVNGESVVLHDSVPVPDAMPQESASNKPAISVETKELPAKAIVPASEDDQVSQEKNSNEVDVLDDSAAIDVDVPEESNNQVNLAPSESELKTNGDVAEAVVELEADGPLQSNDATLSDDFVHVAKTTRAIQTSFELPSVLRSDLPEQDDQVFVDRVPTKGAENTMSESEEMETVPVAPASAIVATTLPSELTISEATVDTTSPSSNSRLSELKLFLKEARSTALHLSLAKKSEGEVSDLDLVKLDGNVKHETPPPTLTIPVAKRVSLLDRLCPKAVNY